MPMKVDGHDIKYELLPEKLRGGTERWIEKGIRPGEFLSSVIEDDLLDALTCADDDMTRANIRAIASWFYWESPPACHGSLERARSWQRARKEAA